jgi:hypothetical protein
MCMHTLGTFVPPIMRLSHSATVASSDAVANMCSWDGLTCTVFTCVHIFVQLQQCGSEAALVNACIVASTEQLLVNVA